MEKIDRFHYQFLNLDIHLMIEILNKRYEMVELMRRNKIMLYIDSFYILTKTKQKFSFLLEKNSLSLSVKLM